MNARWNKGCRRWLVCLVAGLSMGAGVEARIVIWTGSTSRDWFNPDNWSSVGVPTNDDVVILGTTANQVLLTNSTALLSSLTVSNHTLTVSNWTTVINAVAVTIRTNGTLTLPPAFMESQMSNRIHVICTDFTLDAGGKVLADACGYAVTNGPGKGLSHSGSNGGGSGGGHGGKGGSSAVKAGGIAYGSTNAPVAPGSGGGRGASGSGGAGGGAVWIEAAGTVAIEGIISANGAAGVTGTWGGGGGGAGGSVFISGQVFNLNGGRLQAYGGNGGGSPNGHLGGGGGGGRIAVWRGVAESVMDNYLAGNNTNQVVVAPLQEVHAGISVTNGVSVYAFPDPKYAAPGTALFFTPVRIRGTLLLFQ